MPQLKSRQSSAQPSVEKGFDVGVPSDLLVAELRNMLSRLRRCEPPTIDRYELALYVSSMTSQLAAMCQAHNLSTLTYLLTMAHLESCSVVKLPRAEPQTLAAIPGAAAASGAPS